MTNGTNAFKKMEVGKEHAGEVWTDVLGWHEGEVTIGEDGWAEFACSDASISIYADVKARHREEFGKKE